MENIEKLEPCEITKSPSENKKIYVDFTHWLKEDSLKILSVDVNVKFLNSDEQTDINISDISYDDTNVRYCISGGNAGTVYHIETVITTGNSIIDKTKFIFAGIGRLKVSDII